MLCCCEPLSNPHDLCGCVCVCASVCVFVHVCVCACVHLSLFQNSANS